MLSTMPRLMAAVASSLGVQSVIGELAGLQKLARRYTTCCSMFKGFLEL